MSNHQIERKPKFPSRNNGSEPVRVVLPFTLSTKTKHNHHVPKNCPQDLFSKDQIMNNFKKMDKDGDGKLSKADVEAGFINLGASWGSFRAWLGLWHADANNDGFISIDTELDDLVEYALSIGYTRQM